MKRDTLLNSRVSVNRGTSGINTRSSLDQSVLGAFVKAAGTQTLGGMRDTLILDDKKTINDPCQADFEEFFFLPHFTLITSTIKSEDAKFNPYKMKYLANPEEVAIYAKYYKDGKIPTKNVNYGKWKTYLNKYYMKHEMFICDSAKANTKKVLLRSLEKMFNNNSRDSSMIIYAGPANQKGNWLIQSSMKEMEFIQPKDVFNLWKKRKSDQKMLVLVIDSNYSGKWAEEVRALNDESVAVQCSCRANEKSHYFELGGYFSHNVLKMMNKRANEKLLMLEQQNPTSAGNKLFVKKYLNQYLYYEDWFEMSKIAKAEYVLLEFENGAYQGYYNEGKREYWGVFKYNKGIYAGSIYVGEYKASKMHGLGIMTYDNGKVYEGDFLFGYAHGKGSEYYPNGDSYKGDFIATMKEGKGVYKYGNGNVYEGDFKKDLPDGQGVFTNKKDKSKYKGAFKQGKANGKGTFWYPNGEKYVGNWVDDIKNGKGVYTYKNKEKYEGEFVNGKRNGQGTFHYIDGSSWTGVWKDNLKAGTGIHVMPDGKTMEGDWVDNKIDTNLNFYKKKGTRKLRVKV